MYSNPKGMQGQFGERQSKRGIRAYQDSKGENGNGGEAVLNIGPLADPDVCFYVRRVGA